jgi:hypothetical protein
MPKERISTIEILKSKSHSTDRTKDHRFVALDCWFEDEIYRINRLAEIRRESWWLKFVTSADNEGQTPLHYLSANEAPNADELLHAIMTTGRGNFSGHKQESTKAKIRRETSNALNEEKYKIFKANVLYSTSTGHELGSVSKSMTMVAEPKLVAVDEEFGDRQLEMSGLLGLDDSSMNYEIIVPWLMRNIKKRVSDLASKDDPLVLLREMVDDIAGDDTLTLIAPQFRLLLAKLGIKVTKDVIREVCRMYSGESAIVNQKWRLNNAKAQQSAVDEKGSDHRSDAKAETRESKYEKVDSESKYGHSTSNILFGEEEDLGVNMRRYSSRTLLIVLL